MTPMMERWYVGCPFWPVDSPDFLLVVPRRPTPLQVGTLVWALIGRSLTTDDLTVTATDAADALAVHLNLDEDYAPGGLRVTAGGTVIDPGCCLGLDEWRDWLRLLDGVGIGLGHSPDSGVDHRGSVLRLWEGDDLQPPGQNPGADDRYIDIPADALPSLLSAVQQDLAGFLAALRPWAQAIAPDLADRLTTAVDRRLQISAPLDLTGRSPQPSP